MQSGDMQSGDVMGLITVDLGNSRCKLVRWSDDGRSDDSFSLSVSKRDAAGHDAFVLAVSDWLGTDRSRDAVCAVSSVASPAVEDALRRALEQQLGAGRVVRPEHMLAIDSPQPEGVGADRLFAARAAVERVRGSVVVVDAGTALTVDAVRVAAGRAHGGIDGGLGGERELLPATFLGGAIAAGPKLLAEALAAGTARLPRVDPMADPPALGRTTTEAIRAGLGVGFRGAALELVRRVAEEAGLADAPVLITGGAAGFLDGLEAFEPPRAERVSDLVHLGLRDAWRAQRAARGT